MEQNKKTYTIFWNSDAGMERKVGQSKKKKENIVVPEQSTTNLFKIVGALGCGFHASSSTESSSGFSIKFLKPVSFWIVCCYSCTSYSNSMHFALWLRILLNCKYFFQCHHLYFYRQIKQYSTRKNQLFIFPNVANY